METYDNLDLKRIDHLPQLGRDLDFEKLEEVLGKAPAEAAYSPHNNGLYLGNDEVRLGYTIRGGLRNEGPLLGLWFQNTFPKIGIGGNYEGRIFSRTLFYCGHITSHREDSINSFSFPLDIEKTGETLVVKRNPFEEIGERGAPEDWFKQSEKVMRGAAKKYNFEKVLRQDKRNRRREARRMYREKQLATV